MRKLTMGMALLSAASLTASPATAQGPDAPPVSVATPLTETIVDWDEYTGRFEAVERVELRARVSGYLYKVLFSEGELVSAGDPLFLIDQRPFQVAQASAVAQLQAAKAEQQRAASQLNRQEQLVRSRTGAEATLDERRADKLRADAEVAASPTREWTPAIW